MWFSRKIKVSPLQIQVPFTLLSCFLFWIRSWSVLRKPTFDWIPGGPQISPIAPPPPPQPFAGSYRGSLAVEFLIGSSATDSMVSISLSVMKYQCTKSLRICPPHNSSAIDCSRWKVLQVMVDFWCLHGHIQTAF